MPESVLTSTGEMLERLLAVTQEILQAQELYPALDAIAEAISTIFGFRYVTIVAADAPGREMYRRVARGWPEEVVRERLGEHVSRDDIMTILLPHFEVLPHCFYFPVEHEIHWGRSIYTGDLPMDAPRSAPDAWHERDALTLVLPDREGKMMGYLSVDGPVDGKVPSLDVLRKMQLFVNLVGLALSNSRSHRVETEQREAAEANQRAQNNFFSIVSHEVRSPLSSIRGASTLLEEHFETLGETRRRELLEVLMSSTSRLTSIFEDFLLLTRMEMGTLALRIEPVDVVSVVEECIARVRSEHLGCTIEKTYVEPSPYILADEGRVVQVLANLILNAVRYAFSDTPIQVSVDSNEERVKIAVTNQGPGISAAHRKRLFTRFGALSQRDGSTGLGLYICRELIGLMNGTIGFESETDKTTTFWFTLPRAPEKPESKG